MVNIVFICKDYLDREFLYHKPLFTEFIYVIFHNMGTIHRLLVKGTSVALTLRLAYKNVFFLLSAVAEVI